jgi:peptidoglycan/xylan/chitin deacetylase (PgdA/CDA1 family)
MRRSIVIAAEILDRSGALGLVRAARRRGLGPRGGLTVVLYHRVAEPSEVTPLDTDMIDATPAEFDQQMGYLRAHFHPVSIDEVLSTWRRGAKLPADSVLVSFDDGYLDNFQNAVPILRRHGMSGLFFVATGHVSERRLFWWEHLYLLVSRSTRDTVELEYPARERLDLSNAAGRMASVRRLNRIVKDHYDLDLDRFIDGVAAACGVERGETEARALADRALMTWDQIKEMRKLGMGIGSHTRSHRVLQTLPPEAVASELRDSRSVLESHLGEPVTTIAYPVGKPLAELPALRQAVIDAGYEMGFSTRPGINPLLPGTDPFDLYRLTIDKGVPRGLSHVWLTFPFLTR